MSKTSVQAKPTIAPGFTRSTTSVFERQHTLGPHVCVQSEPAGRGKVPSIVHDVLRTLGQPLDPAVRADFELRFVARTQSHTDARVRLVGDAAPSEHRTGR